MGSKRTSTLYHYCSLDTFLSIIKNSSIWLSDVKKSNDSKELDWFRHQYYSYLLQKLIETNDNNIKSICELILSFAPKDGFLGTPSWLLPACNETAEQISDLFNSLRVYTFCLSELSDSLGQWRGYADGGKGVAIGFSKKYLNAITGKGLLCPIFNFMLGNVSYKTDFTSLFDSIFSLRDTTDSSKFIFENMMDITHVSAFFKHPSFKEEKEWRIAYSMNDYRLSNELLHFKNFDLVSTPKYKKNFSPPNIDYIVRNADIIPHVEIGISDMSKAINSIVLGPKCKATEKDIRHLLLNFGVISDIDDNKIKIIRSESSFQ